MRRALFAATAVTCLLALDGCKQRSASAAKVKDDSPVDAGDPLAEAAWDDYVASVPVDNLQKDCAPIHKTHTSAEFKGVALMFHGFSACPQQYLDWLEPLTAAGYDLYVPVLPGHGRLPKPNGGDNYDEILEPAHALDYRTFAIRMAKIVALSGADDKVVVGISAGGALATVAALTGTFKRALIMAPYYTVDPTSFGGNLATNLGSGITNDLQIGWGPGCHANAARGRSGICDFHANALVALKNFGLATLSTIVPLPNTVVQLVGVNHDGAIGQPEFNEAYYRFALNGDANVHGCLYDQNQGMPHSFFSKWDNPDSPMAWMPEFMAEAQAFITTGAKFKNNERAMSEQVMPKSAPFFRCKGKHDAVDAPPEPIGKNPKPSIGLAGSDTPVSYEGTYKMKNMNGMKLQMQRPTAQGPKDLLVINCGGLANCLVRIFVPISQSESNDPGKLLLNGQDAAPLWQALAQQHAMVALQNGQVVPGAVSQGGDKQAHIICATQQHCEIWLQTK